MIVCVCVCAHFGVSYIVYVCVMVTKICSRSHVCVCEHAPIGVLSTFLILVS